MANADSMALIGDFTLFGFTRDPGFVADRVSARLGITPRVVQIGAYGQFFYYSSYGDVAESEDMVVLKLGFLRSATKTGLSARHLLDQKLVTPGAIDYDRICGNGLVVGLSKKEALFTVFLTLMAVPQMYYAESADGVICSDVVRIIIRMLPTCDLNETILPQHFLFRSVYGSDTYFRGVKRLMHGHCLSWMEGRAQSRLVRSMDAVAAEANFIRQDAQALNLLHETMAAVVGDTVRQIKESNLGYAGLLSGGVDSCLVQYYMNLAAPNRKLRSISFAIRVPAFEFEVGYAREASQLLHTEHTFVDYTPHDYAGLLTRVIEILAQPVNLETEPSFLAVAEYLDAASWPERIYFTGQGGDTLFGGEAARKLKGLNYLRKIPRSAPLLRSMGQVLMHVSNKGLTLIKGADMIANEHNPDAYINPNNTVCVYVLDENWDIVRRSFGDQVVRETLANRRELVYQYSQSRHYIDQVYFIDLTTDVWELGLERNQIFLAYQREQVSPFFDEDMIKMALTIHPDLRYLKGFRYKHLLRGLLEQKTQAPVARKRKGPSNVNDDLVAWMRPGGSLRPLVEDIDRPGYIEKSDFDRMINKPDYFMWPLLTLDIFKKRVVENRMLPVPERA